tara:strand:+ start:79 stop:393 length:315 start_codon:yes stop_codon:yes gene_type:complete
MNDSREEILAKYYVKGLKSLGKNSRKRHNPGKRGIIHYYILKEKDHNILKHIILIINRMNDFELENDVTKKDKFGVNAITELRNRKMVRLYKFIKKLIEENENI